MKRPFVRQIFPKESGGAKEDLAGRSISLMKAKGKNFSAEEDLQLCRSYLSISKDSTKGTTNQKAATFYERIASHFNASSPAGAGSRKIRSLEIKLLSTSKACSKFSDAHASVKYLRRSGASADDEIGDAMRAYEVTNGEEFKFIHCWLLLKMVLKWSDMRASKTPNNRATDAPVPCGTTNTESTPRSTGVKSAKAAQKAEAAEESMLKRLAVATARMASSSLKRARALEETNNLALLSSSLDALDADAREYFSMRRPAVIIAMRESMREHGTTAVANAGDQENSSDASNDADAATETPNSSILMGTMDE